MTRTHRDVARRRRRWMLTHIYGVPLMNLVAALALWRASGLYAGLTGVAMTVTIATIGINSLTHYRLGYWRGRTDIHYERASRWAGRDPVSCARAEPWAPTPLDDDGPDLARAFLGRQR